MEEAEAQSRGSQRLTWLTVVRRSLAYYWMSNLAVVFGVAIGAAVLVGSLLVGSSVEQSLHSLALERLGRVEHVLNGDWFFREKLAADLSASAGFGRQFDLAIPAIIVNGAVQHLTSGVVVPEVTVVGVPDDFWRLGRDDPPVSPTGRSVILNQSLAEDVGAVAGEAILLMVGRRGAAPADTVFARRTREHTLRSMRVVVGGVLPARGLGRFSLRSDAVRPRNLYVSLAWLQRQLDRAGQANTLLVTCTSADGAASAGAGALQEALASVVQLEDYGLRLLWNEADGYVSLQSTEFVIREPAVAAARGAAERDGLQIGVASVYMANLLTLVQGAAEPRSIPYSVVAGLEVGTDSPLEPLPMADGAAPPSLATDEIVLNAWAADDLAAKPGDKVEMTYYVVGKRGLLRTEAREFAVRGVAAMKGAALARGLVPAFEGITDAPTMRDWDPPFPIDLGRIRSRDEDYWQRYRAAPKAFVALDTARSLWLSSRHGASGWVTSVRLKPAGRDDLRRAAEAFVDRLMYRLSPEEYGLVFRPVREQALSAAEGSTDFGILFLLMSMFLVVAAAALVGLLLRLTVERRASQAGILLATGFTASSVTRGLMCEGLILTLLGVVIGVPLGVGYAWLILYGLRTWWEGAVGEFAFSLHVSPLDLVVGSGVALLTASAATWWGVRALQHARVLTLLAGWRALVARADPRGRRRACRLGVGAVAIGVLLLLVSGALRVIPTTGAFFGGGVALLIGMLALFSGYLQRPAGGGLQKQYHLLASAGQGPPGTGCAAS